jgi:hypothetical protein
MAESRASVRAVWELMRFVLCVKICQFPCSLSPNVIVTDCEMNLSGGGKRRADCLALSLVSTFC